MDNNMLNQGVQARLSSKQSSVVNYSETEISSDSNIITYSQYVHESQQAAVQNPNSSAQQDALILSVIEQLKSQVISCTKINLENKSVNDTLTAKLERYKDQVKVFKEGQNIDLKSKDNASDSCEQSIKIYRLKQTLSEQLKEKESLMQTVTLLKNNFKKEESRNIDREIALEKKIKQLDNINSMNSSDPSPSCRPTKVEVPKELSKVSMVNTSLKKLKHHLAGFDVVVKERTTATAITEGSWGCLSGKTTGLDSLRLSRAQIIWGMYHKKNIDYVYLLWEDLVYQVENKNSKKNNDMYSKAYKEYYTIASGAEPLKAKTKYKKKADEPVTPSKSKTAPASKGSRLKSPAKVAKTDQKKQPATMQKTKGLAVLSEVPDEQQQKDNGTNEGDGVRPEVPDVPKYTLESEEESWTFKEEEEKANDDEVSYDQIVLTPSDYELTDEEENKEGDDEGKEGEQEQDKEDDLYRDVNINLERSDTEMTDAQANKDMEDAHVTLTVVPPVVQQQSSSVSSDLVSKFINSSSDTGIDSILNPNIQSHTLVNVPVSVTVETLASDTTLPPPPIPNIQTLQQTPSSITTTTIPTIAIPNITNFALMKDAVDVDVQLQTNKHMEEAQAENHEFLNQIEKYVTESLGAEVLVRSTNQPQTSYAVAALLSEFKLKKIHIDKIETNKSINRSDVQNDLYKVLVESCNSDKDIISSYGDIVTLKKSRDDQDKDENPSVGSNRGLKRRRSGKEAKSSKEPTYKESKSTSSSKGASRSQLKSSGNSAQAEEHGQNVDDLEEHTHQEFNTRDDDVIPVQETLEDASQWNPPSSPTPDREWHKTKTADKRPPQPWIS
ncbi:hypothetical protein Tco_1244418 [Tanacetum coccineum]